LEQSQSKKVYTTLSNNAENTLAHKLVKSLDGSTKPNIIKSEIEVALMLNEDTNRVSTYNVMSVNTNVRNRKPTPSVGRDTIAKTGFMKKYRRVSPTNTRKKVLISLPKTKLPITYCVTLSPINEKTKARTMDLIMS
jgi:hypothetical protein